jgi:hypothetical protein
MLRARHAKLQTRSGRSYDHPMLRSRSCLISFASIGWLLFSLGAEATVHTVATDGQFDDALAAAVDGDEIRLAPGTYSGGRVVSGLVGVTIASVDPADPAVIDAGGVGQGFALTNPERVTLESFVVRNAASNGINIDDGGSFESPAREVVLRDLRVEGMAPSGNNDGIKLSGVVGFHVDRVRVSDWGTGGSAIDMVGCHDGLIENSLFAHSSSDTATGVQQKGGSSHIEVRANRFVAAGARAINMGGSTGLAFFRPQPPGPVEASELLAIGNVIVGSDAPVAFVNIDSDAVFSRNYVYRPTRFIARILKENTNPGFVDTQGGVYADNVVVWEDGDIRSFAINVGPDTLPLSFAFERNSFFNATNPGSSDPGLSVVTALDSSLGVDPSLDRDEPIGWQFPWGIWVVNAVDAPRQFDPTGFGPLFIATPGPGATLDLEALDDPRVGNWTVTGPASSTLELPPLSQVVLVPELPAGPGTLGALLVLQVLRRRHSTRGTVAGSGRAASR